jgi:hypothetical protein
MKILNSIPFKKFKMPVGKLTVKWVSSRNVYQCYIGGRYVAAASGDTREDAILGLHKIYEKQLHS